MILKFFSFAFFLLFFQKVIAQDFDYYNKTAYQADSLYNTGNYREAINKYTLSFLLNDNKGKIKHRYNLACCYAQLKLYDSAFQQLFYISTKAKFSNYEFLKSDTCFKNLHASNEQWEKLINLVISNRSTKIQNNNSD